MVTGQNTYDPLVFVQNRVAMLAELQHLLLDVVQPVFQVEAHQIGSPADTAHGSGLEEQPGCPVSIVGGGDDAGGGGQVAQLLAQLCLAQNQTVHIHLQGSADHIRLMAAQYDGFFLIEQEVIPALGQCDGDLAGQLIDIFTCFVENLALQGGKHIEKRHFLQCARGDLLHIVACHVFPGEHTV